MKNNKSIIVFLYFIISGTILFAQSEGRMPVMKIHSKDGKNIEKEPLILRKGISLAEKQSYTKAVLDLNSVKKIKSGTGSDKIKFTSNNNAESSKGQLTILTEDFEGVFPGTLWNVYASASATDAYWNDTNYKYYGGLWSGWCAGGGTQSVVPGINYPSNMKAWMIFGPFDLTGATAATLSFKNWLDTESGWDYFRYMASIDGTNFWGQEISGNSFGWVSRTLDLKNVATLGDLTGKPAIWIAFQFTSDGLYNYLGSYIDNIILEKTIAEPDLTWTNLALTNVNWPVGSSITADLTESNIGTAAAGTHNSKLYLSADNIISPSDTQLGTDLIFSSIAAGGTQVQIKTFSVPDVLDGTYYVGAIVDFNNSVAESDETNNANYRSGTIIISHPTLCPAPTVGTVIQTTCASATGSVVLNGLPSSGSWTLTRTPGSITTTGTGISTTISGLSPGSYSYTVTNSTSCTSSSSAGIVINVQPVIPPVPVTSSTTGLSSVSFTTNWTSVAAATGFYLDVATDIGFTVFVPGFNNKDVGNVTSFSIAGLNAVTTYHYRLRAYSSCGTSPNSATITVATLQNPPVAPTANPATSVLQLTFTANWSSSATATGYRIDISTNPEFSSFVTGYNDKDVGNVTTINVTGLTAGTTYHYRARAYNSGGSGPNSNIISVTTLFYAPVSPTIDLVSGILQTGFTFSWNRVATAAGYKLDVAINNGFTTFVPGYNDKDVGNITTTGISGLSAKTTYYFRVRAYNSGGTSTQSNIMSVTTLSIPPPVPVGLTSSSCNNLVTLKWRKNTGADFLRYRIYGGTTANPTTKIDSSSASSSDTIKIISGLLKGQSYYFRITAVNFDGAQSDFSEQSNATVKSGVIPKLKTKWNDVLVCYNLGDSVKSYQWFNGDAVISGEIKQYFQTNKKSGVYHVEIIDLFGCKNPSAPVPISGSKNITVYPNPSSGSFALRLNDLPDGQARITILNSVGIIVMEYEAELTDNMLIKEIHLNNIEVGVYFVKVLTNKDLYYSRIVIAR